MKNALPRISIVTPSYNQAAYLEETLCSVVSQGYPNLEYIVMDAGSTDGSVEIIKKYEKHLAYWESKRDKGHADGINKGFAHATGEIMAWINSSDVYYPWTLRTVAEVFTQIREAQWVTGIPSSIVDTLAPVYIGEAPRNHYDFLSGNFSWLQQESIFWRRSLWEATGAALKTDIKHACDFELWLRFYKQAPIMQVGTMLAAFRYHEDARSQTQRVTYRQEAEERFAEFYRSYSSAERMRAGIIRRTNNPVGRTLRKLVQRMGGLRWYVHPRIVYDFDMKKWTLVPDPS